MQTQIIANLSTRTLFPWLLFLLLPSGFPFLFVRACPWLIGSFGRACALPPVPLDFAAEDTFAARLVRYGVAGGVCGSSAPEIGKATQFLVLVNLAGKAQRACAMCAGAQVFGCPTGTRTLGHAGGSLNWNG